MEWAVNFFAVAVMFLLCVRCQAPASTSNKTTTITILVPERADILTSLGKRFTLATNNATHIRVRDVGWDGLWAELQFLARTGGALGTDGFPVDLAWVGTTWMGTFAVELGVLRPLTRFLERWNTRKGGRIMELDFVKGAEFSYRFNQVWYAVPFLSDVRVFLYRKDLYRAALGHDRPPATLDDVVRNTLAIRERLGLHNISGFNVAPASSYDFLFAPIWQGFGAKVVEPGAGPGHPPRCALTSEAFRAAAAFFVNLTRNGISLMTSDMDPTWSFAMGNGLHVNAHNWIWDGMLGVSPFAADRDARERNVGLALHPGGPAERHTFLGGSGLALLRGSPEPDAAWEFVMHVLDPASPAFSELIKADIPAFQSLLNQNNKVYFASAVSAAEIDNSPFAVPEEYPVKDFWYWGAINDAKLIDGVLESVLAGNASVEAATAKACAAMNDLIDRKWAQFLNRTCPTAATRAASPIPLGDACVVNATVAFPNRTEIIFVSLPRGARIALQALAGSLIVVAVALCALLLYHRGLANVRLSSPEFTAIVALGCVLAFASICLSDEAASGCMPWYWSICLGFTLVFGSIVVKLRRVHAIFFRARSASVTAIVKLRLRDRDLLLSLSVLVIYDLAILSAWQALAPSRPRLETSAVGGFSLVRVQTIRCAGPHTWVFLGLLSAVKLVTLVAATVLAAKTRNVALADMNESKLVGVAVYSVFFVVCLVVPAALVTARNPDNKLALFAITNTGILLATCAVLFLLLGSRVWLALFGQGQDAGPPAPQRGTLARTSSTTIPIPQALEKELEELRREREAMKRELETLGREREDIRRDREALDRERQAMALGALKLPDLELLDDDQTSKSQASPRTKSLNIPDAPDPFRKHMNF